jgi:hypothetical protein
MGARSEGATRQRLAELVDRERIADFVSLEPLPGGVVSASWA